MFSTIKEIAADIANELREHPERWTTFAAARNASGLGCSVSAPDAVCWCLYGHIEKRGVDNPYRSDIARHFFSAAGLDYKKDSYANINDVRTVEQIIQLCDTIAATH